MKKIIDFLVSEYNVDRSTAATLIITIFIFISGILTTLLINYLINRVNRFYYRKSLKIIIADFLKSCKKQSKIHFESIAQKVAMDGKDFTVKIVPNPSHSYLSSIDISEFTRNFMSICNDKRPKVISKLFELVESVKISEGVLDKTLELASEKYSVHEITYYDNLDELRKINDELINQVMKADSENNPLLDFIRNYLFVFRDWQDNGRDTRIKITFNQLVQPILQLARNTEQNLYSQSIFNYCLKCDISYINMEKLNKIITAKVRDVAHINRRAYRVGGKILSSL